MNLTNNCQFVNQLYIEIESSKTFFVNIFFVKCGNLDNSSIFQPVKILCYTVLENEKFGALNREICHIAHP